jgi:hypothetical protein
MRKLILVAGFAAATLIPAIAFAEPSCGQQRDNQVGATIAGGAIGAGLGSVISPRGNRTIGAVIGGVGGAVGGSELGKPDADCTHAYGYYDRNSQWHATNVDRADAHGYYDRDGVWVDGPPNGYYDIGGRWVAARNDATASGYYDTRGRWVPASSDGYYDNNGQWVASVSGYYDDRGRWMSGPTTGAYDANGRWITGARNGHADANGVWVADDQTGYWDSNHHWRAGQTRGYYDARGVWIGSTISASAYGVNSNFDGAGQRRDVATREAWLEQTIRASRRDGMLSRYDASRDMDTLSGIRRDESSMRARSGQLSPRDENRLQQRLDTLSSQVRGSRSGANGY